MKRTEEKVIFVSDEETINLYSGAYSPSAEDVFEQQETTRVIRKAIDTYLSEKERAVIMYVFFEGYSQTETAKIMGISQPTVNVYLQRALKKMKEELHKYGERFL